MDGADPHQPVPGHAAKTQKIQLHPPGGCRRTGSGTAGTGFAGAGGSAEAEAGALDPGDALLCGRILQMLHV